VPHTSTRQPFSILPKYPHMQPADVLLWERFIRLNSPLSQDNKTPAWTVSYDVHVGTIPALPPGTPQYLKDDAEALYPFKIDVVVYWPTQTLIVELKPRASLEAIGQVLGYTALYHRTFPNDPNPNPIIITDTAHLDMHMLCALLKISLIELDHLEAQFA